MSAVKIDQSDLDDRGDQLLRCPNCGKQARFVPSGTNRSGRSYQGFYICFSPSQCQETDGSGSLKWHTSRQWHFLHRRRSPLSQRSARIS